MTSSKTLALTVSLTLATGGVHADIFTGPQSSQTPYVLPTAPGWQVTSLLTVGDLAKESPYALVGLPDGWAPSRASSRLTASTWPTRRS